MHTVKDRQRGGACFQRNEAAVFLPNGQIEKIKFSGILNLVPGSVNQR